MPDQTKSSKPKSTENVEETRSNFRALIASNPNYFGNLASSKSKAVKKIVSNINFEQLTKVGYNPKRKQLSATFNLKKAVGYGGDLCAEGSTEYVRFYVDLGSGWQDAGIAGSEVYNIPTDKDCANKNTHPLSYAVDVPYSPNRKWCTQPQLPKARAILSWNVEPPAGEPDWQPVYGNVMECNIQIDKGFSFPIFVGALTEAIDLPPILAASIKTPIQLTSDEINARSDPESDSIVVPAALSLDELATKYQCSKSKNFNIEPHRFAFSEYQKIKLSSDANPNSLVKLSSSLADFGIDIGDLVATIEDTTGNISYEELEDLGLDWNQEKLVATYRVKQKSGFSGDLCSTGSTQYVSFWADWGDNCTWQYLDTVEVAAHDFEILPDGGLCYNAILPVDLSSVRRDCDRPLIGRVRAVLSWNTPPSTVNPSAVPHWGNRLDAHVLIPPGEIQVGVVPTLTAVGGIGVPSINNLTGLTGPTAKFIDNGLTADSQGRACPFGGRVVVRGPGFPGHRYRVQVREVGTAIWSTLTKKIWVTTSLGFGSYHSIDPDGWFSYLSHSQNFAGILAYFDSSGDQKWDVRLQIEGVIGSAVQRVQLDNTSPTVSVSITEPVGDCGLITPGTEIKGNVVAIDSYMGEWSVVVDGGPAGYGSTPVTTGASGSSNTPIAGSEWTFDTEGLEQCGYVVRVHAQDRAIVNSVKANHHRSTDVGFCVLDS